MHQTSLYVTEWEYQWLHTEGPTGSALPPSLRHREEREDKTKFGDRVDTQNAHFTQDQSALPNSYLNPVNSARKEREFVDVFFVAPL